MQTAAINRCCQGWTDLKKPIGDSCGVTQRGLLAGKLPSWLPVWGAGEMCRTDLYYHTRSLMARDAKMSCETREVTGNGTVSSRALPFSSTPQPKCVGYLNTAGRSVDEKPSLVGAKG